VVAPVPEAVLYAPEDVSPEAVRDVVDGDAHQPRFLSGDHPWENSGIGADECPVSVGRAFEYIPFDELIEGLLNSNSAHAEEFGELALSKNLCPRPPFS
jgi:hypothetical protein